VALTPQKATHTAPVFGGNLLFLFTCLLFCFTPPCSGIAATFPVVVRFVSRVSILNTGTNEKIVSVTD
jgi:hypothetical protein